MPQRRARRRGANFNLGAEQAEADKQLLRSAFYESDDYLTISDKDDPRCFVIARTGSGKSAALQQLEEEFPGHVVRIIPEDLSLQYITNLSVMRFLDGLDVSLDPLFIALWKHVLLVELIRHRYKVNSAAAKANFLTSLRDKIKRDPGKRAALDYLEEFQDRFWVEADQRIREVTEKFEEKISKEATGKVGLPGPIDATLGATSGDTFSSEVRTELADRFQRIVNETQMARLNKMVKVLDEDILESRQNFTYVVIDDLDRDWVDEKLTNALIRCLFRAVLDLQRVTNLKVIVALRTNIFEHLDFGHRSGGQEEKFRSLALRMRWTQGELKELLTERLRAASSNSGARVESIYDILPRTNQTRGNPLDYMLRRTLMRPRDIIAFINESLASSVSSERLTWEDIRSAEEGYSYKRLLALRDEWKTSYPEIDRVFAVFEGVTLPMSRDEFTRRLDDVITLTGDPNFRGADWVYSLTARMWNNPGGAWTDWYGPLVSLLYNIGFIGCQTGSRSEFRYAQESPDFAERVRNLESITDVTIHPAFQAGLDARLDNSRRSLR
ncbi:P-loop ATPase, Sll1717 family [Streptomyces sp. NPDC056682]|uniref:P-loop ATPase, Sll1717 family n=1 Tax=Streptomyces sp. NPDC056682 TaxID=3345909 RepID=UPI0036925030